MFALYHPTRPPDLDPIRGHGTSLLEEAPTPRISPLSCAVPAHIESFKLDFADVLRDDDLWRAAFEVRSVLQSLPRAAF